MKKFIRIGELSIAYIEVHPVIEKTIFFLHGNSGSVNTWMQQLSAEVFKDFRLVAIDLPGHGDSETCKKPLEDYSPQNMAKIMAHAVETLSEGKSYILCGFSFGTNLIAEMLAYDIKPAGIALIAMCCVGKKAPLDLVFQSSNAPLIFFYNEVSHLIVHEYVQKITSNKIAVTFIAEDYFRTDNHFRPSLIQNASAGNFSDELTLLENVKIPLCIIFGDTDSIVNIDYLTNTTLLLWENQIHYLSGAGHFVHLDTPLAVNDILLRYANYISTNPCLTA